MPMCKTVKMSIGPRFKIARGSAWIGAMLCIVGCSRSSQAGVSQSGVTRELEAIVRDFAAQHRLPGIAAGVW
jgi:hypothetical protein